MDTAAPIDIEVDKEKENRQKTKLFDIMGDNMKNSEPPKVKEQSHETPPKPPTNSEGVMGGSRMTYTKLLESLEEVQGGLADAAEDNDMQLDNIPIEGGQLSSDNNDDLLDELNHIFTKILVMQGLENDITEKFHAECAEANLLVERNIMKFDDSTRMAQLISVCALLLARKENSQQYQMYKKASEIRKNMKLQIQKDKHAAAKDLAQKFLVKVSTTSNSSVARNAATDLLPQTQH